MNSILPDTHSLNDLRTQPRALVFLAYPQMGLLDLTGAQTVFWSASRVMALRGLPGYSMHTASLEGGLIATAEGLSVQTTSLSLFNDVSIDTLIVPGAPNIRQALIDNASRTPFAGLGKPEPLKGEFAGWWSRRIDREHRLVYRVEGVTTAQTLVIASCRFHYGRG